MHWFKSKQERLASNLLEEQIYEIVAFEISDGDIRPGLWAKALSESDGERQRAKALYVKLRVDQVRLGIDVTAEMIVKAAETQLASRNTSAPPLPPPPPAPPPPPPPPPAKSWRCLRCGPTTVVSGYSGAPNGIVCARCKGHEGLI